MVVSKEISDYFTKLVEPLVTTERLEEMFGKLKEEIIERFEEKFTAQNQKIVDLEEKIALQEKKIENLSIKCDDNEQYSRRYCLRMHGLKFDKNESQNDLVSKISEYFSEIGLPYKEEEIDRVHRIGKPYKNEGSAWQWNLSLPSSGHGDTGKMFTGIDQRDLKMVKRNQLKVLLAFHWIWQSKGTIFWNSLRE